MLKPGDVIEKIDGPITRDFIKGYGKASGDKNPIHTNDFIAKKFGLKGVIAHGMLSMGLGIFHVNKLAFEENGKLTNVGCEMRGMLRPGDWLYTVLKVEKIEGDKITLSMIQDSKMPLKIEKDGQVIEEFEGQKRGWVKDKEKDGISTEETPEGTLTYRRWLVNKGWAEITISK